MIISIELQFMWMVLGLNALLAWPVLLLLRKLKSRQTIDPYAPKEHQEKQGTPTMGGLMIVPGLVLAAAFVPQQIEFTQRDFFNTNWTLIGLLLGFGVLGFVDDYVVPKLLAGKRGLGWKQKLILQVGLAAACMALDPHVAKNPMNLAMGVFLILFFSNAYNFADGLDGLAGSLLCAYSFGLVILGFVAPGILIGLHMFVIALTVAAIPFLFLNAPPAKVFMGDVGSLPIGAVLGFINYRIVDAAIADSHFFWPIFGSAVILAMILILELVLVPIQVAYFKKTKKRIFPATPIHHAFEVKGIPEVKVVWWFLLVQIVLVLIAWNILGNVKPSNGFGLSPVLSCFLEAVKP